MKKLLLDYDNTICDFNQMLIKKWATLGGEYTKFKFNYDDIDEYSLINCLCKIGYTKRKAIELLDNFWKVEDLYQEFYVEAKYREKVLRMLTELKTDKNLYIELNTLCNTFTMTNSKLKKLEEDTELLKLIDNIVINTCNNYNKFKKAIDYDIVIDDNPTYIEHYLKNNKSGVVFMPKWNYNEYLLPNKQIITIL